MSIPFKEERKLLPCGCSITRILDKFPYFRFMKYCEVHAKEHGTDFNCETAFIDNTPKFEATDADIERVANYLNKGNVSDTFEISKALGMKGIIVAMSVRTMIERGIVGVTVGNPHKFFFKP